MSTRKQKEKDEQKPLITNKKKVQPTAAHKQKKKNNVKKHGDVEKKKNSKTLNKRQSLHWEAEQGERNVDGATLRKKLFCELLTYCTNTQLCNHVSVLQRWNAPVKKKKNLQQHATVVVTLFCCCCLKTNKRKSDPITM